MRNSSRRNAKYDLGHSVERSLDEYFRKLDGEPAHGVYDMVMGHVEHTLLAAMLARAHGNQTQAADMLGMNRNTLRAKLSKHRLI